MGLISHNKGSAERVGSYVVTSAIATGNAEPTEVGLTDDQCRFGSPVLPGIP
jgi:hypothetical protein